MDSFDALSSEKKALLARLLAEQGARYNHFPTSYAQSRLWFIDQLNPGQPVYNVPFALHFRGRIDVGALERAFAKIIERHDALRTSFTAVNGEPFQVISKTSAFQLEVEDAPPSASSDEAICASAVAEGRRVFDLRRGPLLRAKLLRFGEEESALLVVLHHIVADGWSIGVLFRELGELYAAERLSRPAKVPALSIQYKDFAVWQRKTLSGDRLDKLLKHWTRRLEAAPEVLDLPADRPRRRSAPGSGRHRIEYLAPDVAEALRTLSKRENMTLFMVGLAAFTVLLSRYAGQDDVIVGTPMANRTRVELEQLIGFFVNMVVLRLDCGGAPTFREILGRVRRTVLEASANQELPFDVLVNQLRPSRSVTHQPLFQVVFTVHNMPGEVLSLPGLTMTPLEVDNGTAKYDLVLSFAEIGGKIRLCWEYNSDLFDEATIERFSAGYAKLVCAVAERPASPIAELELTREEDRRLVLHDWNDTAAEVGGDVVAELSARAEETPDAIALVGQHESVTYRDLLDRARRLSTRLAREGARPGERVVVCLPRGPRMVEAQLAVLMTGAAFVSLDASHPAARLAEMILDAKAVVTLTEGSACLSTPLGSEQPFAARPAEADAPAYVIYTSGSSGRPKGTVIPRRGLANLVTWYRGRYHIGPGDRITQLGSPGFDLSILEIWPALAAGATLVFAGDGLRLDPRMLVNWLRTERITITFLATPLAEAVLAEEWPTGHALRFLNTGGDRLRKRPREGLGFEVHNHYGPTEVSVVTSATLIAPGEDDRPPPIGRPIANTQVYVLDEHRRPVPVGVPGELWIGGVGVALGYLGAPELTTERFLSNPFVAGTRMYGSGDRARFRSDGQLEFLGRLDHQVKLRGSRIELGEIECALVRSAAVRDAAVVCHRIAGTERLVAYVVAEPASEASDGTLGEEHVAKWHVLYEDNYGAARMEEGDPFFNVVGWNDSYTGRPLPREQMKEWVEDTVTRIGALGPKRVLEIGVGTGLLLFRLIDRCAEYHGIDFSKAAIDHVHRHLPERAAPKALLEERRAEDLGHVADRSVDTAILNSVVQYFSDEGYLLDVLDAAVAKVADGGHVFIGDVRNLKLLRPFLLDVERSQAPKDADPTLLREHLEARLDAESELVLDPVFFHALRGRLSRVRGVEIWPKRGRYENELSLFRYDVVLAIGDAPVATHAPARDIEWHDGLTVADLRELVVAAGQGGCVVRNIPNARLARCLGQLESFEGSGDGERPGVVAGVHPEDLWALGDDTRRVRVSWGRGDPRGAFDLIVDSPDAPLAAPEPDWQSERRERLATAPLRRDLHARLERELRRELAAVLPGYMVPAHFVFFDALPLTHNGKIDRSALRPPGTRAHAGRAVVAPHTPLERFVASVWEQVLGTCDLDIRTKFFDMGGDSMALVRVFALIEQQHPNRITVADLYENSTIESTARLLAPPEDANEHDFEIW